MIPVILSGGSGTRLWPVSRRSFPKQFTPLVGEPLLVRALKRVRPLGEPRVVAVADNAVLTGRVLKELDLAPQAAIYEPTGRNTAPATALLCHLLLLEGLEDEVVGLFPADHLVSEEEVFRDAVTLAERSAREGLVATLGIHPTYPSTGYGYIESSEEVVAREETPHGPLEVHRVLGFREKPALPDAVEMVASGRFFWNAGMFVFRVGRMAEHLARLAPETWEAVRRIEPDLGNAAEVYAELSPQSLDYAVMERLDEQVTVPCDIGWSDLGTWDEVARLETSGDGVFEEEANGNFVSGRPGKIYGLVGVEDVMVVDTADALLVARKGASQSVKALVERISGSGHPAASEHVFEHRPWGEFEVLRDHTSFKAKILRVEPGARLSYQSHEHRAEHWVVVHGHPEITLDGRTLTPGPGESVYIPQGARHRIANPGEERVEIVEVQVGSYFGEDDITRYEDDYDRA